MNRCKVLRHTLSLLLLLPATAFAQEYTFTDVTATAGVSNDQYKHFGATWSDYDKDGDLDLYVVNGVGSPLDGDDTNTLYRNNGDGTFTDVTVETGTGDEYVAMRNVWADYDRDGDLDFYSHNFVHSTLYKNVGGFFVDANAESGAGLDMLKGTGAAWGDYDNDGWIDLAATSFPGNNALLHNNGDGTFTDLTLAAGLNFEASAMGNVWGDVDNDGFIDLAAAVVYPDSDFSLLWHNNGDGTFTDISVAAGLVLEDGSSNAPITMADYDNDGDQDIFISEVDNGSAKTVDNRMYLFRNNGDLTFTDVTFDAGLNPPGIADYYDAGFADFDNDGDLDVFVGVKERLGQTAQNMLYQNNGDGTFTDVAPLLGVNTEPIGMGNIWGDYDNDGDLDLYVLHEDPDNLPIANVLFQNNGGSNHWLQVEVHGQCSNLDAIGTRFFLKNNGGIQSRELHGGSGFFDQQSPIQQFGLGADTVADSLEIHWPSGMVTILTDVAANQRLTITEDACPQNDDLTVLLTPPPPPVIIDAAGGTIPYEVQVRNNSAVSQTFDMWVTISLQNQSISLPSHSVTLAPGATFTRMQNQSIPASARMGTYVLTMNAGTFPVSEYSDGFPFKKLGSASKAGPLNAADWRDPFENPLTAPLPGRFELMGNYPNPFNPSTSIRFALPSSGPVRLSVYDALGREVTTLVNGMLPAGVHQVTWEAGSVASGVYLYRLEAGDVVQIRHMLLMK